MKPLLLKLIDFLKVSVPLAIKKYAPQIAMKIFGKAGGLYTWFVSVVLKKTWKEVKPSVIEIIYKIHRTIVDKKNIKELEKNETNGATSNEKVQDELDFLNGTKPKP